MKELRSRERWNPNVNQNQARSSICFENIETKSLYALSIFTATVYAPIDKGLIYELDVLGLFFSAKPYYNERNE